MCIIVNKEMGMELPRKEILENCFDYNNDGAGFMYNLNGKVYIEKGFMKFKDFYDRLMQVDKEVDLKEKGLVMHFRISTSGKINRGNCHPYPLSKDENILRKLKFTTKIGVAHNGIISKYIPEKNSLCNDTQLFIKEYLVHMYKFDNNFLNNSVAMNLIEKEVGSKLSFLDGEGNISTIGEFQEYEGCHFSNSTYKSYYKWNFSSSPSEYDCWDLATMCNKTLSLDEFCEVLECLNYPREGEIIQLDNGKEIICNGNYAEDDLGNWYFLDYVGYGIEYIGYSLSRYLGESDDFFSDCGYESF